MIPGAYVASRSGIKFLKHRINLLVKVQEGKKQQIMPNNLHPKQEFATPRTHYVSSIVSSCISLESGGRLTLCDVPDSVCHHSTGKNKLLKEMIKKDHQNPFLNIIVTEFIDSCELVHRIAELNSYNTNTTEIKFSTRKSFADVWRVRTLVHVRKIEFLIFS